MTVVRRKRRNRKTSQSNEGGHRRQKPVPVFRLEDRWKRSVLIMNDPAAEGGVSEAPHNLIYSPICHTV